MKIVSTVIIIIVTGLLAGCGITPIEYDETMLDGSTIRDTSFTDPTFLLSTHPELDTFDRKNPVIICAHGYTASTFEWQEFRDYVHEDGRAYTSLVLLGGHGRSIDEFDGSTWEDWQKPIMKEYDSLVAAGFTNISLTGSSTGGTLILEYFIRSAFNTKKVLPNEGFFIDAIVIPASKLLHIINVVGPILGNSPVENRNDIEKRHWYTNRPTSTLAQLNELIERVRSKLEKGVTLTKGTRAKCYKVEKDDSADPVSALLMYKGITEHDGSTIDVEMLDSDFHVFTQLAARDNVTDTDRALQQRVFSEMIDRVCDQ